MYFHDAETEHTDMKIFWTPASPFTRKVCVAARELGLWERIEVVPTTWSLEWGYKTVPLTAGLAEANPVARIPTLVTEEGAPLGDSTLACIYLDEVSDNGGLIPSGDARWKMWSLYAIADGMLEAQILMRAEYLRPREIRSDSFIEKQKDRIKRCLDVMEARAKEFEAPIDLAQIAAGVTLSYQDWRDWLIDFRPERAQLTDWYERFAARASMKLTEPAETPEK